MNAEPAPKRHTRGLVIVVFLGLLFFALLATIVFSGLGKRVVAPPVESETLTVVAPAIRLRTEPNAKAPAVATAAAGEQLVRIEDRGAWVRLKDADGIVGWGERALLERTGERQRRLQRVAAIMKLPPLDGHVKVRTPLYFGPGIFYPMVGELPSSADVKVYTRDHDFYAVGYDKGVAYADIDAIDVSAGSGAQIAVAAPQGEPQTETEPPRIVDTAPEPPLRSEPQPVAPPPPPPATLRQDSTGVFTAVPEGGTLPVAIDRVPPRYTPGAASARVQGIVVLRGIVRRDGVMDNVEVIRDLPYGLGDAARRAVEQWRFRPATYRGQPIDVYDTVTVTFRLRE